MRRAALALGLALAGSARADAPTGDRPVPFPRDADWIGGVYRVQATEPIATPVPVDFDPGADPDVHVLVPGVPFRIPLSGSARTVYVLTVGQGGLENTGVVADGQLLYADGRTQALKWMVGEQAWPAWAGATGRGATLVPVGTNAAGDRLSASLLAVPTSWPDAPLAALSMSARPGTLSLALGAVTLSSADPRTPEVAPERPPRLDPVYPRETPGTNPPIVGKPNVRDGHFVDAAGARLRFWGVNLVGRGNLPTDPTAFARTLAGLGFNLVRLHHLDQEGVLPNPRRGQPGEPAASPEALDRLDRAVAAYAEAGIYSTIELMTLRSFKPGEGVPGAEGVPLGNKYANQIWPAWLEAEKAWARAVWDRTNPYTGRRYADEPSVAMVELSNENSLVVGWSSGALERLPKVHRDELDRQWNTWLRARYGSDLRLQAAWTGSVHPGLQAGETLSLDSVARVPDARTRTDQWPPARAADLVRFYAERERAHQRALARFVREELGFTTPLVCNTSFGVPAADVLLDDCDVVDVHIYWDPIYEATVLTDRSLVEDPGRALEALSTCRVGKPCVLGELQHSYPNRHAHEAPFLWAALAARQDLDAVTWFAWSHDTPDLAAVGPAGALDLQGRLGSLVQMPAAARLFREGRVPPAAAGFVRWWTEDGILRDLAEQPGLWLNPQVSREGVLSFRNRTGLLPHPGVATGAAPGPGEAAPPVRWADGHFTVAVPGLDVVIGREGATESLAVALDGFATTWLSGPEPDGGRSLWVVTHGDRDGTVWSRGTPGPAVLGSGPWRVAPVSGTVWLRGGPRPRVTGPDGAPVPVRRRGEGWEIVLSDSAGGRWRVAGPPRGRTQGAVSVDPVPPTTGSATPEG